MTVAGLDISTKQIDCCLLSVDDDSAKWVTWDIRAPDAFQATRNVRGAMVGPSGWEDAGVVMVGIEKPMGPHRASMAALMRIQGAVIASIPRSLEVLELTPGEWRANSVGQYRASKEQVWEWVQESTGDFGPGRLWPTGSMTQDQADAYAIAYACRTLCERAAESAA